MTAARPTRRAADHLRGFRRYFVFAAVFVAFLTVFFAVGLGVDFFATAFRAVFFATAFRVVFLAAGLPAVFPVAPCPVALRAGCGPATCFTARFAARSTAATAPRIELLTDLTASFAAFLTFLSMGPCADSFSAFDLWRKSAA